jgi:triacylglycerol esterase/lipase EstA (alpha/beta hydrolase family)
MFIARLQAFVSLGALLACWGLAAWVWPQAHAAALWWMAAPFLISPFLITLQFAMLALANRQDPAPRASFWQTLSAWAGELRAAALVFSWWQPFCSRAYPDVLRPNSQRGVVLVHGYFCNRGFWHRWKKRLSAEGRVFAAVNLEPAFGSIDAYIETIERAVHSVTQATGMPPLLVCHSMGGLAARAWAHSRNGYTRVQRIVTLGTPHHGTWIASWSHTTNGGQMRLRSRWITALAGEESATTQERFVCYYSNCDNIVFPVSTATLPNADNRLEPGYGHVELAFSKRIQSEVWTLLEESSV